MTSSVQFKNWLNTYTLSQSRERVWAGKLYNPLVTAYYPDQRPTGSRMQSYRTREKSPFEPFQGNYQSHEQLLEDTKEQIKYREERDFSAQRLNNSKAGHGRKYFRTPEEQEGDYQDSLAYQKVEPIVRKHHVNTPNNN